MFGDIGKMLKLAAEMKKRVPEVQAQLAASEYSAEAGEGVVKATVNGKLALVGLTISPTLLDDSRNDPAMIEDLIKAAVSTAQARAAEAATAAMKELTGGLELPPGLGL